MVCQDGALGTECHIGCQTGATQDVYVFRLKFMLDSVGQTWDFVRD